MIRIALVGAGAIAEQHVNALKRIQDVEVACIVSASLAEARNFAQAHSVDTFDDRLDDVLARSDIDAVILASPTQLHAQQAVACLRHEKHVLIEIPAADGKADFEAVLSASRCSDRVCMVAHTSRFYPSHRYMNSLIERGEFTLQHLNIQTLFFRRTNTNMKGEPRCWTDHLLWHHAAHSVDLFRWQCGKITDVQAMQGPLHPEVGIAMDMAINLRSESGAICTLSLSFNNDGPLGSTIRYIGDSGTYVARRLSLQDGHGRDVPSPPGGWDADGVEQQDREFVSAILENRTPATSIEEVADCYRTLALLEDCLR